MAKSGKRLRKAYEAIDRDAFYGVDEAVKTIKERATAKFDETIEVSMNLGIDPRHADQNGGGKASSTEQALIENVKAFVGAISRAKPAGAKGTYIRKVSLSSTMGPGMKREIGTLVGG